MPENFKHVWRNARASLKLRLSGYQVRKRVCMQIFFINSNRLLLVIATRGNRKQHQPRVRTGSRTRWNSFSHHQRNTTRGRRISCWREYLLWNPTRNQKKKNSYFVDFLKHNSIGNPIFELYGASRRLSFEYAACRVTTYTLLVLPALTSRFVRYSTYAL